MCIVDDCRFVSFISNLIYFWIIGLLKHLPVTNCDGRTDYELRCLQEPQLFIFTLISFIIALKILRCCSHLNAKQFP